MYQTAIPHILLAPFVKGYWALSGSVEHGQRHVQRVIPDGLHNLYFFTGKTPVYSETNSTIGHLSLTGITDRYYDLKVSDEIELFSVSFWPGAIQTLFQLSPEALANRLLNAEDCLKAEFNRINDLLCAAGDFQQRVQALEAYWLNKIQSACFQYNTKAIRQAVKCMSFCEGPLKMKALVKDLGMSESSFRRYFTAIIGCSPKTYFDIIRFQKALFFKQTGRCTDVQSLAYLSGYYDQSHFISHFKEHSGYTPHQLFSESEPYSDYFM